MDLDTTPDTVPATDHAADHAAAHGHGQGNGHATPGRHSWAQDPDRDPAEFWEARYSDSPGIWSGRVNASLARVVEHLPPGRSLDLGAGEGGDVVWLARQGWRASGVEISPTAVARGRAAAASAGVEVDLVAADLADWEPAGQYDLVSASFLQSPVALPRADILRSAARTVAPGGRLVLVAHAAPPPWADVPDAHEHVFPTPESELADLALDPAHWTVEVAEVRTRPAVGPDRSEAMLEDSVVVVRRG